MKILILSLFFLPTNDSLNVDSLERSLIEFYHFKSQSEIIEFSQREKLKFMKYLPIPSLTNREGQGYKLEFQFSISQIYGFANQQEKLKKSIESIEKRNEVLLKRDLYKLKSQISIYENQKKLLERKQQNLSNEKSLLEIERQLYEIDKSKYERNELSPAQFLSSQKSLIVAETKFEMKEFEILQIEIEIKNQKSKILELAKTLK